MAETMTDVQKAIEQLGRNRPRLDSASNVGDDRSFSFASTHTGRDGDDTDTDLAESDIDGHSPQHSPGETWHKSARAKLAEKARRAVEEAEKLENMMNAHQTQTSLSSRIVAPPIEVELSDESEGEEEEEFPPASHEYTRSYTSGRRHSNIMEEDEEDLQSSYTGKGKSRSLSRDPPRASPSRIETTPSGTATVSSATVSVSALSPDTESLPTVTRPTFGPIQPPPPTQGLPTPVSPPPPGSISDQVKRAGTPQHPSSPLSNVLTFPSISKHSSLASDTNTNERGPLTGNTLVGGSESAGSNKDDDSTKGAGMRDSKVSDSLRVGTEGGEAEKPPTDWNVDDVVEWLTGKGFGVDVTDKFVGTTLLPAIDGNPADVLS